MVLNESAKFNTRKNVLTDYYTNLKTVSANNKVVEGHGRMKEWCAV